MPVSASGVPRVNDNHVISSGAFGVKNPPVFPSVQAGNPAIFKPTEPYHSAEN